MRRMIALVFAGLVLAGPARSQQPCSSGVQVPVGLRVSTPLCPGQDVWLIAEACGPCVDLTGWIHDPGHPIQIFATLRPDSCLNRICEPETLSIFLGGFAAGHHVLTVDVNGEVLRPDSAACTTRQRRVVEFDVPLSCEPPGTLPYTDEIRVGFPGPICPGIGIPIYFKGHFPSNCWEFRGFELLPNPMAGPLPQPPIVRVLVAFNDCLAFPCGDSLQPWSGETVIPGLPPGFYQLMVRMDEVSWCDSSTVIRTHRTLVPFQVARTCSVPPNPSCFLYGWQRGGGDSAECSAYVGPGTPGRVLMNVSGLTLAGLQGRLQMYPARLRISDIRLAGPGAVGMRLLWNQTPDGASFVTYRESGPICGAVECPWSLAVAVEPIPGVPIPPRTYLDAIDLLGTDDAGREVPLCPTFAPIMPAVICAGPSCDWNHDARVDVRDLVLMVRCHRDSAACSDSAGFDCNRDGGFDLDDVLCCARVILRGRLPDSVATRAAPEVRVQMGAPRVTAAGVDVPVRVSRADLVGAGRLAFSYPGDRFSGARLTVLGEASRWIGISEADAGEMVVGVIAAAPDAEWVGDLEMTLHFDLASGRSPSTAIELLNSEFAGKDGVPLAHGTPTADVTRKAIGVLLSPARPNPFGLETRFVLTVSRDTQADLGVFDLGGRRMATLHHGSLAAGDHSFRWDGTTAEGTRASDGVYFYRAVAEGVSATRKLVLMRTR